MKNKRIESILNRLRKEGWNVDQYKPGDTIKVVKKNKTEDIWRLLGFSSMKSSGQLYMRVRHETGFNGHIMMADVAKIEKVVEKFARRR